MALIGMPPISGFIGKALMLKAALAGGQAGWIWPPILLASLAALLMLSRSGGTLFWRARGDHSDGKRVQPTQIAAVAILVITLPTMVIFAGWITEYAQLAASEMTRGVDLSLLGGDDA